MSDSDKLTANDYSEAAANAGRLGVMFAGLVKLAPVLAKIGALQQAADEAQSRKQRIDGETETARTQLSAVNEKIALVHKQIDDAKQTARDIKALSDTERSQAIKSRDAIVAEGHNEARKITTDATAEANRIVNVAKTEAASFDPKIAAKREELSSVENEINVARGQLADARATIRDLREGLKH